MKKLGPVVKSGEKLKVGCELCTDGYILRPKKPIGFEVAEYCDCIVEAESLKASRKLYEHAMVPDVDISEWKEDEEVSFDTLLDVVENNEWLFLHGDTGTGKTYTASIIAMIATLKEKGVYFGSVPHIMDKLRPNEFKPKLRHIVRHNCSNSSLLILDDIGQEKSSDWVREQLYLIIDDRYNNKKPIIFTSNFDIERLKENLGKAIYSRVKSMAIPLSFDSEDRRIK